MKSVLMSLLLLLAAVRMFAQSCADYDYSSIGGYDITSDKKQHINGQHTFNGGATFTCNYASVGAQYCSNTASVVPYGAVTDAGLLSTVPLGYHVSGVALNPSTGVSNGGGASANGNAAAAVEWCLSSSCSVAVSANPVSFPSGSVWTHAPTFSMSCVAKVDPEFTCGVGCHCCTCQKGAGCESPILVDVKGTGFQLSSAEGGVVFDIRGDGKPELVAWPVAGSGNAFLALDRNNNGIIDSGKELFGDHTSQPKCAEPNGFLALDVFDENHDGIIDKRDPVYSQLRLWIDANRNGISEPGELHPLAELGVYSISLDYTDSPQTDVNGNAFKLKARVNPEGEPDGDHVDRWTYDVWLVTETDVKYGKVKKGVGQIIYGDDTASRIANRER